MFKTWTGPLTTPSATLAILLVLLSASFLTAIALGPLNIPTGAIVEYLLSYLGVGASSLTDTHQAVIENARIPRALMAMLVGGALATGGTVMQSIFRNPLAEPGVLGISSGAAFGAALSIALGFGLIFPLLLPAAAFVGALVTTMAVMLVAGWNGRTLANLILTGLALSSLLSALLTLILLSTDNLFTQRQILFWLAGGLDASSWRNLGLAALPILVGLLVVLYFMRDLNTMMTGDDEARSLGTNISLVRVVLAFATALIVGTAVAFTGIIAFVGIIVPHALRLLVGHDNRIVVPFAVVGGALFMVLADTLARTVLAPTELRVGIITALLGAPFFLVLLTRNRLRMTGG